MILEKQTEANVVKEGDSQESIGMSLDMESAQVLMQMLSKNLYSDSVGSTIRECASNALDSHRRANVTDPIIVSLEIVGGQWEFSVEDFGIGLDGEDVKNIISKYGKSTKRDSANELGMMGLGFKAPLAYSSSFYFVCRKDGIERKYMMYEGEDTNTIDQLYEKATKERNGVKVIIPIKSYDRHDFIRKTKEQLAYFQNVYFNVPDIDNSFTIVRSEDFQWSELCGDNKLHICLDDVYYPLDFSKIGINNNIYFPIGLRFSLTDGIFPTPNRESIRYTKEAKTIILEKIGKVADYYVSKFNEEMKETENLVSVMNWHNYNARYLKINGRNVDISPIAQFSKTTLRQPKLKGTDILSSKMIYDRTAMLTVEYSNKFIIEKGKMRKTERSWTTTVGYKEPFDDNRIYYVYSDRVSGLMRDYLKDLHKGKIVHLVKKTYDIPLKKGLSQETYHSFLNLSKHPKSDWRAIIKEWQYVTSLITSKFRNLDELEIPEQWINAKKKAKGVIVAPDGTPKTRKIKLQGEVIGKEAQHLERYVDGQNCKFVSTTYKLQEMHKMKYLYVYGNDSWRSLMNTFFKSFQKTVKFVLMSEREINVMKKVKIHNWMSMEEFTNGENKPFRRIATAFLIEELQEKNKSAFKNNNLLEQVSSDLYNKIEFLDNYEDKNNQWSSDEVKQAVLGIAKPNKLFDMEVYSIFKEVEKVLEELPFINTVCGTNTYNNKEATEKWVVVMRDLFRFHKRRMDWKQYKITLNEDVVTPMTEEIIQEA